MTIDYIWHFWVPHQDLTHFGPDYWLPLPSVVVAAAMKVWGGTMEVAARTSVAASVAVALAAWLFARCMGTERWASAATAATVFLSSIVAKFSVQADSSLYYSTLALCSMALGVRGRAASAWPLLLGAGALSGCTQLCRNDGVLVLASLVFAHWVWRGPNRVRAVLGLAGGHLAIYAAYAGLLWRATGRVFPAHGALPNVLDYEDLYRLPPGPSAAEALRAGWWEVVLLRQRASLDRAFDFAREGLAVPVLALMIGVGVLAGARLVDRAEGSILARVRSTSWLVPGLYAALLFLFHVVVTPVVSAAGAYTRSLPAVIAVLVAVSFAALRAIRVPRLGALLTVALVVAWPWYQAAKGVPLRAVRENNDVAVRLEGVRAALDREARCFQTPIVVMTRDPWELTELTGHRSVQIPNAGLSEILAVAARYRVTHLIPSARRRALAQPELATAFGAVPGAPGLLRSVSGLHTCR